jgi:acyl-CoA synthetase (AMP-forming)/AMP-acid ligase II
MRKAEHQVAAGQEQRLASLGREVAMAQLRIIGPDGNDAPEGERGEMLIKGPNVMSGYWKNPEATAEVLQGGWYRTGDVVSRDEEGFYYMVDRVRDMIISGGLNIYPAEVEAAIRQHPSVADVAVIGIPDERWGESVKAFVVLNQSMQASEEEIIRHAQHILAGYKKPRSVEFVAGLPKGSTGKVLKRQLRDDYWRGNERAVN